MIDVSFKVSSPGPLRAVSHVKARVPKVSSPTLGMILQHPLPPCPLPMLPPTAVLVLSWVFPECDGVLTEWQVVARHARAVLPRVVDQISSSVHR